MRSATGYQLERAANLSVDSDGKRVTATPPGYEGIRCRETRPHALSSPVVEGPDDERIERRKKWEESLTDLERAVLRLQGKLEHRVEQRKRIYAGDLARHLLDGYTLIPGSDEVEHRRDLPSFVSVEVVGYEVIQIERLNCEAIAEELGVTLRMVKRAVVSAGRKTKG